MPVEDVFTDIVPEPSLINLDLLGTNPCENTQEGPEIHVEIANRWNLFLEQGISKEDRKSLLEKHPIVKNCKRLLPPILNREIQTCLGESSLRQDSFLQKIQEQLGSSLSALAEPLNTLFSNPKEETNALLPGLVDAASLLTDVHHSISLHRRYLVCPSLNPSLKKTIDDSPISSYLFGDNFSERIRDTQQMKKTTEELRIAKPGPSKPIQKENKQPQALFRPHLNYKRPAVKTRFKKPVDQHRRTKEKARPSRRYR